MNIIFLDCFPAKRRALILRTIIKTSSCFDDPLCSPKTFFLRLIFALKLSISLNQIQLYSDNVPLHQCQQVYLVSIQFLEGCSYQRIILINYFLNH